jgi:hypothetical protein
MITAAQEQRGRRKSGNEAAVQMSMTGLVGLWFAMILLL